MPVAAHSVSETVHCEQKKVGSTFKLNDHSYLVVDDQSIRDPKNLKQLTSDQVRFCTSHATNMQRLFAQNWEINQTLGDWDTSHVVNMREMFRGARNFNQPIGQWDVSNVKHVEAMFYAASSFNQPLDQWQLSATNSLRAMFFAAYAFNQPLEKWDTSKITDMGMMFKSARSFDQPLNSWDMSHVEITAWMFRDALHFNHPLDQWNTANIRNMDRMFFRAERFNQNIRHWDVTRVEKSSQFADESGLSRSHYPAKLAKLADKAAHEELVEQFGDKFSPMVGVGVGFKPHKEKIVVFAIFADSPAAHSSIVLGDQLIGVAPRGRKIQSVLGKTSKEVIQLMKGPLGSEVKLALLNDEHVRKVVTLKRENITHL